MKWPWHRKPEPIPHRTLDEEQRERELDLVHRAVTEITERGEVAAGALEARKARNHWTETVIATVHARKSSS